MTRKGLDLKKNASRLMSLLQEKVTFNSSRILATVTAWMDNVPRSLNEKIFR